MSFESALTAIDNEIKHRKLIQGAAIKIGCENIPTMVANRSEIAELEQIRANLEAIQGMVK